MVADTTPGFPARRADAQRNRDRILTAARAAFAKPGQDVSMAEVSRRAGVGMATLYRNFPGRRELLEALYSDEVDAVCAAAETIDAEAPGDRLLAWLHRFFGFFTNKHPVGIELLQRYDDSDPFLHASRDRVIAAGRPLFVAAQRSGEIRNDLTLEQVLDMIIAIATIDGTHDYVEPILQSTLHGLRPWP